MRFGEEESLKDIGCCNDPHDLPIFYYREAAESVRKHQLDRISHRHLWRHYYRVGRHRRLDLDRIQIPGPPKYVAIRDDADKSLTVEDTQPSKVAALHQ